MNLARTLLLPVLLIGGLVEVASAQHQLLWQDRTSHSDSFYIDGHQVRSIEHDGTTIGTFLLQHHWEGFSDSWHVRMMVRNNTDKRMELDPATIRLIDTEKSQYVRQESPAELVDRYADVSSIQRELESNRRTQESNKRRAQTRCPPLIGAPGVMAAPGGTAKTRDAPTQSFIQTHPSPTSTRSKTSPRGSTKLR